MVSNTEQFVVIASHGTTGGRKPRNRGPVKAMTGGTISRQDSTPPAEKTPTGVSARSSVPPYAARTEGVVVYER
jgi:hypothetical protein